MLQINEIAMGSVVQARQQDLAATMAAGRRRSAFGSRLGLALIRLGESLQQECQSAAASVAAQQRPRLSQG